MDAKPSMDFAAWTRAVQGAANALERSGRALDLYQLRLLYTQGHDPESAARTILESLRRKRSSA
jgi:hypothetical protein